MNAQIKELPRSVMRGFGQVMFQDNALTGLLIWAGILWGSYENHVPAVAWGALVGTFMATVAGYLSHEPASDGDNGLWGFNGCLVGCGFATFCSSTWLMWVSMIGFAMLSTWIRRGLNNMMAGWKINSLTFPFVLLTWIFLLACRSFSPEMVNPDGLSTPALPALVGGTADYRFCNLVIYWLKGVSQVFLVNSWVAGIFILVALAISSRWVAVWAAIGSAVSLAMAILFHADPSDIANGLFGFSPVLTAIALATTFYSLNWKSAIWALVGIIATFFVQAAMDAFMGVWGIPTLTGPFCLTTWLFLLPWFKLTRGSAS